ncbi:short chain dehydrogenase/ reductase-like protein [Dothidotthia symphoricarpi CBS 119687]|uniref:Short chain dehydrogenase/ reductase-like protein n=1 Tax=Dothidotthia symphoricarpi CBS 119687 TaxID=1392245 RepID=A0A6A6ARQ2_9PLEO|nr:short chain dehydrogenase/ reductase-like protein [Dothidotthia symphoricarpi CBS 119687]KAF2133624.1 short chain dehydrogenase/ reductase-like protein [Dothidotthia symphoricarpi CBS 119687]
MSDQEAPVTAYPSTTIKSQDQSGGPGLDKNIDPYAEWTRLEFWDDDNKPYLKEYEGRDLLKGKAALITGGDSGIGRSVAILFAREGADVSIVYLPEEEEDAQFVKKKVEEAGRKANLMQFDLKDRKNCEKAVEGHMKAFGKLNVLVNNAAMQEMQEDISEIDLDVTEKTFQTNIISMFAMTKYAIKHMKRGDTIVNSASVAAYMSNPVCLDYASTKGAITTFTRGLAQQQAKNGIRVNAVAPGIIWTPLQPATKGNPPDAMKALGVGACPLNRPGMPIEMATLYVTLASPLGSYCTGETLHGSGGLEMQG